MKKIIFNFTLLLLVFLVSISYSKGIKAKDFALKDENGKLIKLSELKGNIVLLVFWATTCNVCKKELPEISFLQEEYINKPVKFYAIVIDAKDLEKIKKIKQEWEFDIPVLFTDYNTIKNYRIIGTPIIYILRKDLTVGKIYFGATSLGKIKKSINKLLKKEK